MRVSYTTFALLCAVCITTSGMASQLYVSTNQDDIIQYNTATGSYNILATTKTQIGGLGYTSAGTLYGSDTGSAPNTGLFTINQTNGKLTFDAYISGNTSGEGALTSASTGGTLYYFDHSNNLFKINPNNGVATLIGPVGFSVGGSFDLSFGPDGKLYASSFTNLYRINPTTGAGTLVGATGQNLQGLMTGDGKLYGFAGTSMYSINLSSGALTFVRNTPTGLGNFDAGIGSFVSSPEPAPVVMTLAGLLLISLGTLAKIRRTKTVQRTAIPAWRIAPQIPGQQSITD